MKWMFLPFARATDFEGRSCRREYWMFMLLKLIASALLALALSLSGALAGAPIFSSGGAVALLGNVVVTLAIGAYLLVFLLPEIALTVRRWHDIGNSGWVVVMLLVWALLPYVGFLAGIVHILAMCTPGNKRANQYGPNPAEESKQDFATA